MGSAFSAFSALRQFYISSDRFACCGNTSAASYFFLENSKACADRASRSSSFPCSKWCAYPCAPSRCKSPRRKSSRRITSQSTSRRLLTITSRIRKRRLRSHLVPPQHRLIRRDSGAPPTRRGAFLAGAHSSLRRGRFLSSFSLWRSCAFARRFVVGHHQFDRAHAERGREVI